MTLNTGTKFRVTPMQIPVQNGQDATDLSIDFGAGVRLLQAIISRLSDG